MKTLQIFGVLFGCFLLNGQLISGQDEPRCKPADGMTSGGVPSCRTENNQEYGVCCRWNSNEGVKEGQCCPKDSDGMFYCNEGYNSETCTMEECKDIKRGGPDCTNEFFGNELPEGITSVRECCRLNGSENKKDAAQCCIVTRKETKCESGYVDNNCRDYSW